MSTPRIFTRGTRKTTRYMTRRKTEPRNIPRRKIGISILMRSLRKRKSTTGSLRKMRNVMRNTTRRKNTT